MWFGRGRHTELRPRHAAVTRWRLCFPNKYSINFFSKMFKMLHMMYDVKHHGMYPHVYYYVPASRLIKHADP